jgi:hypothetical protein
LDKSKEIKVLIQKLDTSKVVGDLFASAFILTLEGKYESLEPLRLIFLKHLNRLAFNHQRILSDEVSAYIATQIYPLLNNLENLLRRYIVKFFITKLGLNWWEIIVPKDVRDTSRINKNNEIIFTKSDIINTDVSLMNFDAIGEIIYQQKTAFSKIEDIVKKIESATSLEDLKAEVQSNYAKYFKDYFERTDFEKQWKRCCEIRNKVAHNNLFVQQDLNDAYTLSKSLTKIINDADEKVDEAVFNISEKEAIAIKIATEKAEIEKAEGVSSQFQLMTPETERDIFPGNEEQQIADEQQSIESEQSLQYPLKLISEEEVINQISAAERRFKNGFVGLRLFVTEILGSQGYSYSPSYAVINILADKELIVIYDVPNPNGTMPTKAIKLTPKAINLKLHQGLE